MLLLKSLMASFGAMLLFMSSAMLVPASAQIKVVGSSTVFPFATAVAERFANKSGHKTPIIESTGSGGGLKLFCKGLDYKTTPSITNASRRIKMKEFNKCIDNDVKAIVEFKVGYDGIVVGNSKQAAKLRLTRMDIYNALRDGSSAITWSDVNPALPQIKIEVLGPPPTSGTRDAFMELVMQKMCRKDGGDKKTCKGIKIREDGAWIDSGENDNLIVSKLNANKNAVGVFGFSFLDQNKSKIQGAVVDRVAPTFENIASGKYPVSRSLWFYVKQAHLIENNAIAGYVREWFRTSTSTEDGYLVEKGLIPMPKAEWVIMRNRALAIGRKKALLRKEHLTKH